MTAATLAQPWNAAMPSRSVRAEGAPVKAAVRAKRTETRDDDLARVEALIAGRPDAWRDFVDRYARVIYAAVQRRLVPAGRASEVEDVAQEVFVKLCSRDFRLLRNYDPARAKLTTWLTVIATSSSIDHLRRQSAPTSEIEALPESVLAVAPRLPERVKVPAGLLSPRQTLVLHLLYGKELEVAEAAALLEVDPQTIRSTHHKALTKLRNHFQAETG